MNKNQTKKWIAVKRVMQKQYYSIIGERIPIRDSNEKDENFRDFVSFTNEPAIYFNLEKKEIKEMIDLDFDKFLNFEFGGFISCVLKSKFSNYNYLETLASSLSFGEQMILYKYFELLEEPFLQIVSSKEISSRLVTFYNMYLSYIYKTLNEIEKEEGSLRQFLLALTQFSLMGTIKGEFSDYDAEIAYKDSEPAITSLITQPNSIERVNTIYQIFMNTKNLWEEVANQINKLKEDAGDFSDFMDLMGVVGFGDGEDLTPEELSETLNYATGAFKKIDLKEITKEEKEEIEKKEEDISKDTRSMSDGFDEMELNHYTGEIDMSNKEENTFEEVEITRDSLDFFDNLIKSELSISNDKSESSVKYEFKEIEKKYNLKNFKCLNEFVNISDVIVAKNNYNKVVLEHKSSIDRCYKEVKKLFKHDETKEETYKSSGSLSIKRMTSGKVTSKIFSKRLDPKHRSDLAVMLVIDESGSMGGSRIERAKACAINLSEIFAKMKIPMYTLGFTADTNGATVVHSHYSDWSNKLDDRLKLTSIYAKANNFDGYSIRYASKLLEQRKESHKLLIVISDGSPVANAYNGGSGVRDTTDAIREARSFGQYVLGVAIGADKDVLQGMYGEDFIYVNESKDMFSNIIKKFQKMVKKW